MLIVFFPYLTTRKNQSWIINTGYSSSPLTPNAHSTICLWFYISHHQYSFCVISQIILIHLLGLVSQDRLIRFYVSYPTTIKHYIRRNSSGCSYQLISATARRELSYVILSHRCQVVHLSTLHRYSIRLCRKIKGSHLLLRSIIIHL